MSLGGIGEMNEMRIGIVACETFKRELDLVTEGDPDIVHKEYLEWGLHEYPEELKRAVVTKVNSLQGKVDAVLLGYGVCQSLKDIEKQMTVPTIRLEGDDCVGVLLTQPEYDRERKKCAGTWYAIPYVAEMGAEWFRHKMVAEMGERKVKELEDDGYDTDWFLHQLFSGYTRALFIDTGIGQKEHFESLARRFAAQLSMRYESRMGTLDVLRADIERTKALARSKGVAQT